MKKLYILLILVIGFVGGVIAALIEAVNWIPFPGSLLALSAKLIPWFAVGFVASAALAAVLLIRFKVEK